MHVQRHSLRVVKFPLFLTPHCNEELTVLSCCLVISPLPHAERRSSEEVCLFTRDEPQMTTEQTVRFYKKLMEERGVANVTEVNIIGCQSRTGSD